MMSILASMWELQPSDHLPSFASLLIHAIYLPDWSLLLMMNRHLMPITENGSSGLRMATITKTKGKREWSDGI